MAKVLCKVTFSQRLLEVSSQLLRARLDSPKLAKWVKLSECGQKAKQLKAKGDKVPLLASVTLHRVAQVWKRCHQSLGLRAVSHTETEEEEH